MHRVPADPRAFPCALLAMTVLTAGLASPGGAWPEAHDAPGSAPPSSAVASGADALGASRLFFTASERAAAAGGEGSIGTAPEASFPHAPSADADGASSIGAVESADASATPVAMRERRVDDARGRSVPVTDARRPDAVAGREIDVAGDERPTASTGPRFEAVVHGGRGIGVLIGGRPCALAVRVPAGTSGSEREVVVSSEAASRCALPDRVRTLALREHDGALIVTFADGRRRTVRLGEGIGR